MGSSMRATGGSRSLAVAAIGFLTLAGCGTRVPDADLGAPRPGTTTPAGFSEPTPESDLSLPNLPASGSTAKIGAGGSGGIVGSRADVATPAREASEPIKAPSGATRQPDPRGERAQPQGGVSKPQATPVAPGQSSAAPPGSPVVIGTVGNFSGPTGRTFKDPADAVSVWARSVNAQGGVNGHEVRHVAASDDGDPAKHASIVRELVERFGVKAFVALSEDFTGLSEPDPYLVSRRIPVIPNPSKDYNYDSPYYFPAMSSGDALSAAFLGAWAQVAVPKQQTKLGIIYCAESPSCEDITKVVVQRASEFGLQPVYSAKASLAQPDFTAECLAARNAGAQILASALEATGAARIARACNRQGYHPLYAHHVFGVGTYPDLAKDPQVEGMIVSTPVFPWVAADNPARQEFFAAMAQFAPATTITGTHTVGWVSAKLLEKGMKDLPEPPTSEAIAEGLWTVRDDDLLGLTQKLTFSRDRGAERRECWGLIVITGGRFTAPSGGNLSCKEKD